jgi:phosphate:Na+ symporter
VVFYLELLFIILNNSLTLDLYSNIPLYHKHSYTIMEDTDFGVFEVLKLIGALGFFIFGMKVMSEGIQKAAGQNLRKILGVMTKNRVLGVITGFSVTSIVQSSSATTVMIVSFVNAGLLNLRQAIGVIMGANIGTTMTAVLITVFGFSKMSIASYALPVIAIGFPFLFAKKDQLKSLGETLIGFALLFMGLEALKTAIPPLNADSMEFLAEINSYGALSTVIFIALGTLLTVIVQSSSAAIALTLALCDKGIIQYDMAAAIVLGENIGTTITANLAAIIANVHAKRAARAHLLFNVIGVIWMFIVFSPFLKAIEWYMVGSGFASPYEGTESVKWGLTIFHISFNIINTFLLIWFVGLIEKLAIKAVPSKGFEDEQHHLEYISSGMLGTPELSILEAKKEVMKFGKINRKMLGFITDLMTETDQKKIDFLHERVEKYENITDRIEIEVAEYLRQVSEGELSHETSGRVRSMLRIIDDMESIGDVVYQMSKVIQRKQEERVFFLPEQRNNIIEMLNRVDNALAVMITNLDKDYEEVTLDEANQAEAEIDLWRNELRKEHLQSIEAGEYNIKSGMIYADLYSLCEKLGDHVINVSEAITGQV